MEALREDYPDLQTIYPSHGEPGSAMPLIEAEIEYLATFQNLVTEGLAGDGEVTTKEKAAIAAEMEKRFPEYKGATGLTRRDLLEQDLDWLAGQLAEEDSGE